MQRSTAAFLHLTADHHGSIRSFRAVLMLGGAAFGQATQPIASVTLGLWPAGKMPGKGAAQAESELPPKGDGFTE